MSDLNKEKRMQTSKNSRVKCFVEQRNKKEVDKMDKTEQEFNSKMNNFSSSR